MIKKFKQFESEDSIHLEDQTEARSAFNDSESFISFYYRDMLIKNIDYINDLMSVYKSVKFKEFDRYFLNKIKNKNKIGVHTDNPNIPSLGLTVQSYMGIFNMSFSFKDLKPITTHTNPFIPTDEWSDTFKDDFIPLDFLLMDTISVAFDGMDPYDVNLIHNMMILWKDIYDKDKLIHEVIDFLGINPVGYDKLKLG